MSKVNAVYHIVFATKKRRPTIPPEQEAHLHRFIWKKLDEHKCELYRIGSSSDHVHMLINLHPSIALADLMREVKSKSSGWLQSDPRFPWFEGWGQEYFAATIAYTDRHPVMKYIDNQRAHHHTEGFQKEIDWLCGREDFTLYPDDLQ